MYNNQVPCIVLGIIIYTHIGEGPCDAACINVSAHNYTLYSETCLRRPPMGQDYVALIRRWSQYGSSHPMFPDVHTCM